MSRGGINPEDFNYEKDCVIADRRQDSIVRKVIERLSNFDSIDLADLFDRHYTDANSGRSKAGEAPEVMDSIVIMVREMNDQTRVERVASNNKLGELLFEFIHLATKEIIELEE